MSEPAWLHPAVGGRHSCRTLAAHRRRFIIDLQWNLHGQARGGRSGGTGVPPSLKAGEFLGRPLEAAAFWPRPRQRMTHMRNRPALELPDRRRRLQPVFLSPRSWPPERHPTGPVATGSCPVPHRRPPQGSLRDEDKSICGQDQPSGEDRVRIELGENRLRACRQDRRAGLVTVVNPARGGQADPRVPALPSLPGPLVDAVSPLTGSLRDSLKNKPGGSSSVHGAGAHAMLEPAAGCRDSGSAAELPLPGFERSPGRPLSRPKAGWNRYQLAIGAEDPTRPASSGRQSFTELGVPLSRYQYWWTGTPPPLVSALCPCFDCFPYTITARRSFSRPGQGGIVSHQQGRIAAGNVVRGTPVTIWRLDPHWRSIRWRACVEGTAAARYHGSWTYG